MPHTEILPACPACSARFARRVTEKCTQRGMCFGNVVTFLLCEDCGFVQAPDNDESYVIEDDAGARAYSRNKPGRIGTKLHAGREYYMASMAIDMLERAGKDPKSILIFGAGLSLDHVRLRDRFHGLRVMLSDLDEKQPVENYIDVRSAERFDVVVACEVVEHFKDVVADFSGLIAKVAPGGIAVMSTEINDSTRALAPRMYPFVPGHTAYYTGRSLTLVAQQVSPGLKVDFRAPLGALAQLGPRKRYVLMYQDAAVGRGVSEYFAEHLMAPSEVVSPSDIPRAILRWIRYYAQKRTGLLQGGSRHDSSPDI